MLKTILLLCLVIWAGLALESQLVPNKPGAPLPAASATKLLQRRPVPRQPRQQAAAPAAAEPQPETPVLGKRFRLNGEPVSCVAVARLLSGIRGLASITCRADVGQYGEFPSVKVYARGDGLYSDGQTVVDMAPLTSLYSGLLMDRGDFHTEARILYPGKYEFQVDSGNGLVTIPFEIPIGRREDVNRDVNEDLTRSAAQAHFQMELESARW